MRRAGEGGVLRRLAGITCGLQMSPLHPLQVRPTSARACLQALGITGLTLYCNSPVDRSMS
jgi:hypothetical protein